MNFDRRYSAIDDIPQPFITFFFQCPSGFYCPFFWGWEYSCFCRDWIWGWVRGKVWGRTQWQCICFVVYYNAVFFSLESHVCICQTAMLWYKTDFLKLGICPSLTCRLLNKVTPLVNVFWQEIALYCLVSYCKKKPQWNQPDIFVRKASVYAKRHKDK